MSDTENELRKQLEQLQTHCADLERQLRMRESERDLLAVMLNEAENAPRGETSFKQFVAVQKTAADKRAPEKVGWTIESLPVATVLVSRRGAIKMSNLAAEILTGYSAVEMKELFIYHLLGVSHLKDLIEKMALHCQNKVVEITVKRKDSSLVPTFMTMSWPSESYYAVVCFLTATQIDTFKPGGASNSPQINCLLRQALGFRRSGWH